MILIKSLSEPPSDRDGKRILVSHYWPEASKESKVDAWLRELGSPLELMANWHGTKYSWSIFKHDYLKQLTEKKLQPILEKLYEESCYNTVTLLCHCKKDGYCHRSLLKEYLEKN
jgi:uncharacterized protein YeaO (DUF488 family)